MSIDVGAIVERARIAATEARRDGAASAGDRERLKRIAAEFESMLLVQMLRDMRKSGSWDEEDDRDMLGAETLFETLDVELASHLARVQGLGLQDELLDAFDRVQGGTPAGPEGPALRDLAAVRRPGPVDPAAGIARRPDPALPVGTTGVVTADPFVKPVEGDVTSAFGWRRDPFTSRMKFHQGVDLRAAYGQEVQAAGAGRVVFSGDQGGYGTSVVIEHEDGTRTRYAHLSAALVGTGDRVGAGEPVGRAGHSGRATGTHLHFEVIGPDGRRLPPRPWAGMDVHTTERSGD